MRAASPLIQVLALSACLALQAFTGGEYAMAGVRRAIRTLASAGPSIQMVQPSEVAAQEGVVFAD